MMYDATHEGLIQSWIDRFQSSDIYVILEELWEKDQKYF
jgi:dipeptidyl-peptidase-3